MAITYSDRKIFTEKQLQTLFMSVAWESARYPDRLALAMKGYDTVFSAWDGDRLVGMACAMDDGVMTAYVHYLLVEPEYQGHDIGKTLIEAVKNKYADYLRIAVIAYNDGVQFYEKCGFQKSDDSSPMYISRF